MSHLRWRVAQAVERRWWRRYLRGRDPVAYAHWKRDYWIRFLGAIGLAETLQPERQYGLRVLDAGCGPAGVFMVYPLASVTAVDPLLAAYDELPAFSRSAYPNVAWRAEALEAYQPADAFDLVFCLNVVNHVRDLAAVLEVLAKAVAPDGTVVLSVDAHRHAWLKPVFRAIPGDVLHPHQMDLDEYVAACGQVGLRLISKVLYKREAIFDYWVLSLKRASR